MACTRGCVGIGICEGNIACVQLQQDTGTDCAGIALGFTRLQVNAAGDLEVCSNVGGVCTCESVTGGGLSTIIDNVDGTFTHDDGTGNDTTLDVCSMLTDAYNAGANWQALGLNPANWATETGMQPLEFRCLCTGEVQFRGCIEGIVTDGAVNPAIGIVPVNNFVFPCHPAAAVRFGGAGCSSIEIAADGTVTTNPSTTPLYRCFDGLSYHTT